MNISARTNRKIRWWW